MGLYLFSHSCIMPCTSQHHVLPSSPPRCNLWHSLSSRECHSSPFVTLHTWTCDFMANPGEIDVSSKMYTMMMIIMKMTVMRIMRMPLTIHRIPSIDKAHIIIIAFNKCLTLCQHVRCSGLDLVWSSMFTFNRNTIQPSRALSEWGGYGILKAVLLSVDAVCAADSPLAAF